MIVDWSMLESLAYCSEKFHLSYVENWGPARVATSLAFGGALHKGLNLLASKHSLKESVDEFLVQFAPFDGMDDVRTLEKGAELLRAYVDQDREGGWEVELTEVNFSVDLTPSVTLAGKIDKLGRKDGVRAIQDWKTSTQPWQFVANPNHQATCYLLGGRTILDPTIEDFYFELVGVFKGSFEGFRTIRGKGSESARTESVFQSVHVNRTTRQVEEFIKDVVAWSNLMKVCLNEDHWPMNTANCNGKYGLCPFHPACLAGEGKQAILEVMYKKVKWDPLKGESTEL